jgi:hypothetical protein
MTSGVVSGDRLCLSKSINEGHGLFRGDEIESAMFIARVNTITSFGCRLGFMSTIGGNPNSEANSILSIVDTGLGSTNIHFHTREASGTIELTDTGVAVGTGWNVHEIRQDVLGELELWIDGLLEATHTTAVPDTETLQMGTHIFTRTSAARTLDIDYISYSSKGLGARTS